MKKSLKILLLLVVCMCVSFLGTAQRRLKPLLKGVYSENTATETETIKTEKSTMIIDNKKQTVTDSLKTFPITGHINGNNFFIYSYSNIHLTLVFDNNAQFAGYSKVYDELPDAPKEIKRDSARTKTVEDF